MPVCMCRICPSRLYRNSTGDPVKCKLSLAATEDLSMVIFYHLAAETDKTLSVQEVLEGTEDMENTGEIFPPNLRGLCPSAQFHAILRGWKTNQ